MIFENGEYLRENVKWYFDQRIDVVSNNKCMGLMVIKHFYKW